VKIPTVDGIESEGLVVLALVYFMPFAYSFPRADVGLFLAQSARSSECIPSMLMTITRRILWLSSGGAAFSVLNRVSGMVNRSSNDRNLICIDTGYLFILSKLKVLDIPTSTKTVFG